MPSMLAKLPLYFRSVIHLKPSQILARLAFRRTPHVESQPVCSLRSPRAAWVAPVTKAACWLGEDTFRFLNETHRLSFPLAWNDTAYGKLWLYNLHYFDGLQAADVETGYAGDLIDRWIEENPMPHGNGWEPYPTSLRIVNWLKWHLQGHTLKPEWTASLATQLAWLSKRLEHHLLANHLMANAKALLFGGLVLEAPQAEAWYATGRMLWERELNEQILLDGGHFERSPMYHAIILEDHLDVLNVHRAMNQPVPDAWGDTARRMITWLQAMSHPDGDVSFFNDSAIGIAPSHAELLAYAEAMALDVEKASPPPTVHLSESGYVRVERETATFLIDVAPVGPDYQPGHAHADTLSFELSVGTQRVLVNSGTSVYGISDERLRQRKTAAHNTVVIDSTDSTEVWSGFRVARRARVADVAVTPTADGAVIEATHDGYTRLPKAVMHRRRWAIGERQCVVSDRFEGIEGAVHQFDAHLHIAPGIALTQLSAQSVALRTNTGDLLLKIETDGVLHVNDTTHHPRFGVSIPTQKLIFSKKTTVPAAIDTVIRW